MVDQSFKRKFILASVFRSDPYHAWQYYAAVICYAVALTWVLYLVLNRFAL